MRPGARGGAALRPAPRAPGRPRTPGPACPRAGSLTYLALSARASLPPPFFQSFTASPFLPELHCLLLSARAPCLASSGKLRRRRILGSLFRRVPMHENQAAGLWALARPGRLGRTSRAGRAGRRAREELGRSITWVTRYACLYYQPHQRIQGPEPNAPRRSPSTIAAAIATIFFRLLVVFLFL